MKLGGSMKLWIALLTVIIALSWGRISSSAEKTAYPVPRFPSYTNAPKSIDDVMPYARAIARQTTGLQGDGFGILKDGESVALVLSATALSCDARSRSTCCTYSDRTAEREILVHLVDLKVN